MGTGRILRGGGLTVAALLCLLPIAALANGPAYLVKDRTSGSAPDASSSPAGFADLGGVVLFVARDDAHGRELWRSDGTEEGTALVKDLVPGPGDGAPGRPGVLAGGRYCFAGTEHVWCSDGTAAGTTPLTSFTATHLVADGDRLYLFSLFEYGVSLWRVDLASADVTLLRRFPARVDPSPTLVGGRLFFAALDADGDGIEREGLWTSDGTADGTRIVRRVTLANREGGSEQTNLFAAGGQLFFAANAGGWELWRSDGTADGTYRVRDINPGDADGFRFNDYAEAARPFFAAVDDVLFFLADDGVHGLELWRSDGTEAGTVRLSDVAPGARGLDGTLGEDDDSDVAEFVVRLTPFAGRLYFTARTADDALALWSSDGTVEGTAEVTRLTPDWGGGAGLGVSATTLFVSAGYVEFGGGLFASDGSASGMTRLAAVGASAMTPAFGGVVFAGADGTAGVEPWFSDGTPSGTRLLADLVRGHPGLAPQHLTDVAGTLFFSADDGTHGRELWRSDGSEVGTVRVADIAPGGAAADPVELCASGTTLYFAAGDGVHGRELWRSDGSDTGTRLVRDLDPAGDGNPFGLVADGRGGVFFYTPGELGYDLWHSDGTIAGTERLLQTTSAGYAQPVLLGDALLFVANTPQHGDELWRSDGTPSGTRLLADVVPGVFGSAPQGFARVGDQVLFFAFDDFSQLAIWRTDGTAAGTERLAAVGHTAPGRRVVAGGRLVFEVYSGFGFRLWQSDGTVAGTRPATNVFATPRQLAAAGDAVFTLGDGLPPHQLSRLDCSVLYRWLPPVPTPVSLTAFGDRLLFGADESGTLTLWTSDGTAPGTVPLQTLPPPADDRSHTYPRFVRAGETIFFASRHGHAGDELWALPAAALPPVDDAPCAATPTPTPVPGWPTPAPFDCPDGTPCTVLELDRIEGEPGARVTFGATLHARELPIAGIQNDIAFPPGVTLLARENGHPDCVVDETIDKPHTSFSFQPSLSQGSDCRLTNTCTGMRALVLSVLNVDPIPDGARLYTCTVELAADLAPGDYPLALSYTLASDPHGNAVALDPIDGVIHVVDAVTNPIGEGGSATGSGGCQTVPLSGSAWPLLLGLLLWRARR